MSRATINRLLALAIVDPGFCNLLLTSPVEAAQQHCIDLAPLEREVFLTITAHDLQELSQQLLEKLEPFL